MYRAAPSNVPRTTSSYDARPVSKTDVLLFKQLANPTRTVVPDSASKLMQNLQLSSAVGAQQPRPARSAFPPAPMFGAAAARPARSAFPPAPMFGTGRPSSAYFQKNAEDVYDDEDLDDDDGLDDDEDLDDGNDGLDDDGLDDGLGESLDGTESTGSFYPGDDGGESPDIGAPPPMAMSRENVFDNVPMPSEDILDPEAERMQRQMYIQNLRQFQSDGHVLSISLTDDTPTSALRSEFEVIQETIETTRGVKQLIMGVFVAIKIIEGINKLVLRNMLPIDGLADHLKDNCSQELMIPLRRIHNMYFRNSFGNPFVQLGTAIAFSSISYMLSQDTGIISNLFSGVMSVLSPGQAAATQSQPPPPPVYQQQQQHHHRGATSPFSMGSGFTAGGSGFTAGGSGFTAAGSGFTAAGSGPSVMHKAPAPSAPSAAAAGVTPVSFPSAFTRKIHPPPPTGVQLGPKDKIPFQ